jgi:vitamin-K-epoxide reductase (warfarin-sensitive)
MMWRMRYLIAVLAVAGLIVSVLALRVHHSNAIQPCDFNSHWDCGTVNHSRYAVIHGIPVAALGIAGYAAIVVLALARRRFLLLMAAFVGLCFALYLSHIEAHVLMVWCLYCVISQGLIALIFLASAIDAFLASRRRRTG